MKRICLILAFLFPLCAFATDMCARDDTMVFIFDLQIGGKTGAGNAIEWSWYVEFPYGRIAGDATCLSSDDAKEIDINIDAGLKGLDVNGNQRTQCWCRMAHPFFSGWIFTSSDATAEQRTSLCANRCAYYVQGMSETRIKLLKMISL